MPHVLLSRRLTSNLQVVELSRSSYPCLPRNTAACGSPWILRGLRVSVKNEVIEVLRAVPCFACPASTQRLRPPGYLRGQGRQVPGECVACQK